MGNVAGPGSDKTTPGMSGIIEIEVPYRPGFHLHRYHQKGNNAGESERGRAPS